MVSEIIREKIIRNLGRIPHSVATEVISWIEKKDGLLVIGANIMLKGKGKKV